MPRGDFRKRSGDTNSFDTFVNASHNANTYNKLANDTTINAGTNTDVFSLNITMPTGGGTLWLLATSSGVLGIASTAKIVIVVDAGEIIGSSAQNLSGAATEEVSMAVNLAMALSAGVHAIKLRIYCTAGAAYVINAATQPTFDHAALFTELRV